MSNEYDDHYQTRDYFGDPFPELIAFFASLPEKGVLLDLGCGQGRDALALARLGYQVTGIDSSEVGIRQMIAIAEEEELSLEGIVGDVHAYEVFSGFDYVLLDSFLHFGRQERKKELELIARIVRETDPGAVVVVCLEDTGKKVNALKEALLQDGKLDLLVDLAFKHQFIDRAGGPSSRTRYRMVAARK